MKPKVLFATTSVVGQDQDTKITLSRLKCKSTACANITVTDAVTSVHCAHCGHNELESDNTETSSLEVSSTDFDAYLDCPSCSRTNTYSTASMLASAEDGIVSSACLDCGSPFTCSASALETTEVDTATVEDNKEEGTATTETPDVAKETSTTPDAEDKAEEIASEDKDDEVAEVVAEADVVSPTKEKAAEQEVTAAEVVEPESQIAKDDKDEDCDDDEKEEEDDEEMTQDLEEEMSSIIETPTLEKSASEVKPEVSTAEPTPEVATDMSTSSDVEVKAEVVASEEKEGEIEQASNLPSIEVSLLELIRAKNPEFTATVYPTADKLHIVAALDDDNESIVATLSKENAGDNASMFETEKLQTAFIHAFSKCVATSGLDEALSEYKFTPSKVTLDATATAEYLKQKSEIEDQNNVDIALSEYRQAYAQSAGISFLAYSKGSIPDAQHGIKDGLVRAFESAGVKDAQHIVARVYAEAEPAHIVAALDYADKLVQSDTQSRNHLATALAGIDLSHTIPNVAPSQDVVNEMVSSFSDPMPTVVKAAVETVQKKPKTSKHTSKIAQMFVRT